LHGYRLGDQLSKIVSRVDFASDFPQIATGLEKLNIAAQPLISGWDTFYNALLKFKLLHGHVNVPLKFVIPNSPPWTRLEAGMKLGTKLSVLRSLGKYVHIHDDRVRDLLQLGFEWHPQQNSSSSKNWSDDTFCRVVAGLLIFRDIFPEREIPMDYNIPKTPFWPKELHGMKLGAIVGSLRNLTIALNRQQTKKIEFENVIEAIGIFKQLYNSGYISMDFVVPTEQKWPNHLWNLKLGECLVELLQSKESLTNDQR
jgi:hypothetical protein